MVTDAILHWVVLIGIYAVLVAALMYVARNLILFFEYILSGRKTDPKSRFGNPPNYGD